MGGRQTASNPGIAAFARTYEARAAKLHDVSSLVIVEREDAVALVTLNRPEKRNALSLDLRAELTSALDGLAGDDAIRCVVLTGAGSAFCAGMDTSEFGGDRAHKERIVELSVGLFRTLGAFPKPLVAAVNGPAVAGGFAVALLCDVRVASTAASMGFLENRRGIPPSYAAARAALPAALATELCLTGRLLDAGEALARGVVSAVHPPQELAARAADLAGQVAAAPPSASLETKRRILIEREACWGPLFEREEQALREALLGES
jgi:enoyl-CoA hydratase